MISRSDHPDRRDADALEVFLDPFGLAVEVVDVVLLAGDRAAAASAIRRSSWAASGSSRPIGASSAVASSNVACGTGTSWPRLSPRAKTTVPGSTSFQFRVNV